MTYIKKLLFILSAYEPKFLFISILVDPHFKIFAALFLIWFYLLVCYYIKNNEPYKIESYKLKYWYNSLCSFGLLALFFIYWAYLFAYIIYRLFQGMPQINLLLIFYNVINSSFNVIVSNAFFICAIFLWFLFIFRYIKRKIFKNFLMLKIYYIRSRVKDDDLYDNKYDTFITDFVCFFIKIWAFPFRLLKYLNIFTKEFINSKKYNDILEFWVKWCPFIITVVVIFFDLCFNHFVLLYYYYVLPFIIFYRFLYVSESCLIYTSGELDIYIYHYLYDKIIKEDFEGFTFESGFYLTKEDFDICCENLEL